MGKIHISQINLAPPNFAAIPLTKEKAVLNWLIEWVKTSIKSSHIQYGDFLPDKPKLAKYLGVSTGTIQNAIRQAEDMGYFDSRQSVGTVVRNPQIKEKKFEKTCSKKDAAAVLVKKYILDFKLKIGSYLPCAKELSTILNVGENTLRLALNALIQEGILEAKSQKGGKISRIYKKTFDSACVEKFPRKTSLAAMTAQKMKEYIIKNYKPGDKIISNEEFCTLFNVSIRTVNEASKLLNEQNIILSRRGRYGTIYLNDPQKIKKMKEREEKSLFMSHPDEKNLQKSYLYCWEKTLDTLKKYITQNHEPGDKIPSMKELANILNVSTNTVRRAVSMMCEDGYLIARRGKYGGVFILEMPQNAREAYTWLALNPDVINVKN